jgi:parallel beta-helix repeat protein
VVEQKAKLVIAIFTAVLIVFLIVGTSCLVVPDRDTATEPQRFPNSYNLYGVADLSRIIIDSTGSVYPPNAPIQKIGDTYLFTSDVVNQTIEIRKDNIFIDGSGHLLLGHIEGNFIGLQGLYLNNRSNITVANLHIDKFWDGIVVQNSSEITFRDNTLTNIGSVAIMLDSCKQTEIIRNTLNNISTAIAVTSSTITGAQSIVIAENIIINAGFGFQISAGCANLISKNEFIFVNNPIWVASNLTVISNNTLADGIGGIGIGGKYFVGDCYHSGGSDCAIFGNKIQNFTEAGIYVNIGVNNTITENSIAGSAYGLGFNIGGDEAGLWPVENNRIYLNDFLNNTQDIFLGNPGYVNQWDNGYQGNYWDKFKGIDNNNDGISDIPYIIYPNHTDRYPLMNKYNNYEIQQSASSQILAICLGIGLVIAIAIMAGIALYIKSKVRSQPACLTTA